jgi:hypothetical protein
MTGGLFDPLGTDRADAPLRRSRPRASVVLAGLILAALATLLGAAYLRDDGDRGRPVAVVPIEHVPTPTKPPAVPAPPVAAPAASAAAGGPGLPAAQDGQEVEIQNGVRIVRPRRDGTASGSQTIRVPDAPH